MTMVGAGRAHRPRARGVPTDASGDRLPVGAHLPRGAVGGASNNDSWNSPDDLTYISAGTGDDGRLRRRSRRAGRRERAARRSARPRSGGRPATGGRSRSRPSIPARPSTRPVGALGHAAVLLRRCCNDDVAGDALHRSRLTFTSVRGTAYLVQVGGVDTCAPPLNPAREGADHAAGDDSGPRTTTALAATRSRPTWPGRPTTPEPRRSRARSSRAAPAPFAATIWHRWTAPGRHGDLQGRGDVRTRCSPSIAPTAATRRLQRRRRRARRPLGAQGRRDRGEYLLQVGAHGIDSATTGKVT